MTDTRYQKEDDEIVLGQDKKGKSSKSNIVVDHKKLRQDYLSSIKDSCEQKLHSIRSDVYTLSGVVSSINKGEVNTGVYGIDLGIEFQPFDESGEKSEIKNDICACIVNENSKTVIIGEPGCGKSVSLLKLTIDFAIKALEDEELYIPILIPLGGYKTNDTIESYIKACMGENYKELFGNNCIFLFDALNEVATAKRTEVIGYIKKCERYVVSCRALDYRRDLFDERNLSRVEILELDLNQIKNAIFSINSENGENIKFWREIGGGEQLISFCNMLQGDEERASLFWSPPHSINNAMLNSLKEMSNTYQYDAWEQMHAKGLLPLCRNPMMLRMLYELYSRHASKLPSNRGLLFQDFALNCIDLEIKKRSRVEGRKIEEYADLKNNTMFGLTYLAKSIIEGNEGTGLDYTVGRALLIKAFGDESTINEIEKFAQDANVLEINDCYRFPHQLHQEYFASRYLQEAFEKKYNPKSFFNEPNWWEPSGWEEVSVILIGILDGKDANDFLIWLAQAQPQLVIRCIENAGVSSLSLATLNIDLKQELFNLWLKRIKTNEGSIKSKIYIGQALDKIGDLRRGVGTITGDAPDIKWIDAKGGKLKIAKYPITVIQFMTFLNAKDGYSNDNNWDFVADNKKPNVNLLNLPTLGNGPIVNISWYEAMAFCKWYSRKTGTKIRLPSELEWIENIHTNDNLSFITESDLSNLEEDNKFVSVGLLEMKQNDSIEDVGLVWEWCIDTLDNSNEAVEHHLITGILKGGSWRYPLEYSKKEYRFLTSPTHYNIDIGFRVVMDN